MHIIPSDEGVHALLHWQASLQATGNSAGAEPGSTPGTLCSLITKTLQQPKLSCKTTLPQLSLLQRCILLILEQPDSLESHSSILPLYVYTEEYSFDYKKLHKHLSVRENNARKSIIRPDDRKNILVLYYLQHNTHFVNNNLLRLTLSSSDTLQSPLFTLPNGKKRNLLQCIQRVVLPSTLVRKSVRREGRRQGKSLRGNGHYKSMSFISACFLTFLLPTNASSYLQSFPAVPLYYKLCTLLRVYTNGEVDVDHADLLHHK